MRTDQLATATIAVVLSFALTGCGTGPDTEMSTEQAEAVAQAVAQHVGVMGFSSGGASASVDASMDARASMTGGSADIAPSLQFDHTQTCSGGGDIQYSGTLTADSVANTLSLDADVDYNECTEPVLQKTVTLTTRPMFDVTAEMSGVTDSTGTMNSNVNGPFDWEMGGDSGNCEMDLTTDMTWTITQTGASVSGTTTGQICGREIDRSFESSVTTSS